MRPCTPLLALCVVFSPDSVLGQPPDPSATAGVARSLRAGRISTQWDDSVLSPVPPPRGASRDSVKDGAIVGAVIGAVAFGSGIGVAIDAARNGRPGVSVGLAIRF